MPRTAILLLFILGILVSVPARAFLVALDPGHGGNDHGTLFETGGRRYAEKDITLALAQEAALQLRSQGIDVRLTRKEDIDLGLPARTALANQLKADVFVSIHMNGAPGQKDTQAHGIETYILNNTSDESSKRLARLENAVLAGSDKIGTAPAAQAEGLDVALILKDLRLDANLSESKRLACYIQTEIARATSRMLTIPGGRQLQPVSYESQSRGVKQALFHVLLGADMPGILIESGFLDHPRDRDFVLAPAGRISIGRAIADAVERFRKLKDTEQARLDTAACRVR